MKIRSQFRMCVLLTMILTAGFAKNGAAQSDTDLEKVFTETTEIFSNLREEFRTEQNYYEAVKLGDHLLLIGMYVPETDEAVAYLEGDGEIYYEENFRYRFDLYSPEENAVIAHLDTEEVPADYYQISGSNLLLVDYENAVVRCYDETLTLCDTFDCASFLEDSDGYLYAAADGEAWYLLNYEEKRLQRADFSAEGCILSDGGLDAWCASIRDASPDGTKLLLSVVDEQTYRSSLRIVDAADLSALREYESESFFYETISDDAFLAQLSEGEELYFYDWFGGEELYIYDWSEGEESYSSDWSEEEAAYSGGLSDGEGLYFCDWFDGETIWFTMPEDWSASLMDNYILAIRDALYVDGEETPAWQARLYDAAGSCVSEAGFLGDPGGDGECDIYVLSEPVYFEQYGCCYLLISDVNEDGTALLVWELGDEDADEDAGVARVNEGSDENEDENTDEPNETAETIYVAADAGNDADGTTEDILTEGGWADADDSAEEIYIIGENAENSDAADSDEEIYMIGEDTGNSDEAGQNEVIHIISGEDTGTDLETDAASDSEDALVTQIADPESCDWGDLAEVRARADALEKTYGITIYLGSEVPSVIGEYTNAQCLDADPLTAAIDQLELILSLYPENFFPQLLYDDLREIRIYLTGALSGDTEGMLDDPGAYVSEIDHAMVMVLDVWQAWDWDYILNHEFSHMIDRALTFRATYQQDALFSEEDWSAYNPEGFEYLYTYEDYEDSTAWYSWPDYFIDPYGTTWPTEDRAQIFGTAMSGAIYEGLYDDLFTEGSPLLEKLNYYSSCIRNGFDTTGWDEVLPWERYGR